MSSIRQWFAPIAFILVVTLVSTALAQFGDSPQPYPAPPSQSFSATPPDAPQEPTAPPMARPKPKPDGRITLELRDGSRLVGRPQGLSNIKFKARFGEVSIAVKSIAGIRFPTTDKPSGPANDQVTLIFGNGDVLTGKMQIHSIELESVWGKSTVALEHVCSIINSVDKQAWLNDGRWRLVPVDTDAMTPFNTHGGVISAGVGDAVPNSYAPSTTYPSTPSPYPGTPYSPGPY